MSAIESVLQERRIFPPSAKASAGAAISGMDAYKALTSEAERDYEGFWARLARETLSWHKPFETVLDESNPPFYKWFEDGEINASYNCIDRHVEAGNGAKKAIIFEADDGTVVNVTYQDLLQRVCRFANALKKRGVKKGDRVVIYMPMSIEGVVAMQACARIGATHSVVFGGFSSKSLNERLVDVGAVALITADEQMRGGKANPQFQSMLAFLQGASASRDAAQQTIEFALSQRPEGVAIERASVELLSPVPRPESIREFMVFEQHVINCTRRFGMPRWVASIDRMVDKTLGRKATLAYRMARPWYERPVYYKGNRMNVIGDAARVTIPRYTKAFDWELEFGIFLCQQGRDIPKEKARDFIGGYTIFNDFSARDIQKREMGGRLGPAKGKDFDGGNAIGPVLVTPEEIPDPHHAGAGNSLYRAFIDPLERRADRGRPHDATMKHPRYADILHEGEPAGDLAGNVEPGGRPAHDRVSFGILQRCVGIELELEAPAADELPVGYAPAGRPRGDLAVVDHEASLTAVPSPSRVTIRRFATTLRGVTQERTASPSKCTVQAPHCPRPQPKRGPRRPSSLRST